MIRARAGRLAASLAIVVGVAVGMGTVAAQAQPRQDPSTTTTIPGATTEPSLLEGTPTSEATTTTTQPQQTAAAKANQDNRRVWYVVAGLVGVAVLLAALTIYYAIRTRPSRAGPATAAAPVPTAAPEPKGEAEPEPVAPAAFPPRRSRPTGRSVAGLDHSGSDDDWSPRGTGEHDRVEPASVTRSARPSRAARQAVLGGGARSDDRR